MNYSLGFTIDTNSSHAKKTMGIPKTWSGGTTYYCCSVGCWLVSDNTQRISVTQSVVSDANCYPGSSEIPTDICDRGMYSSNGGVSVWAFDGVKPVATAGTCPQGPP
jgi:hypothetical protein